MALFYALLFSGTFRFGVYEVLKDSQSNANRMRH